jgi:uncharacterized protein (UPF0276 family)
MIERDDNIPEFPELRAELAIAERIAADILPADRLRPRRERMRGVA